MIKLFRKIRQNLLSEGKTKKYFKYAIGEIFLVVIGILLALSINDWNTQRELEINNKVFLKKMLKDLTTIEKRLNELVYDTQDQFPTLEEAVKACDSVLKLTYLGLDTTHLKYVMDAPTLAGNPLLNLNDNTYSELSNTGKLYSLGSETLVDAITNYYKEGERQNSYNESNNGLIKDGMRKSEDGFGKMFLDYNMDPKNFDVTNYPFYFDKTAKKYKDFQLGISYMLGSQGQNMKQMQTIIAKTIILKELIKTELEHD